MTRAPLAGVILAAGPSVRLGQPKQLVSVGGIALVTRIARIAVPVCPAGVVVVTGAHHEQLADVLAGEAVRVVRNPEWHDGLSASIRRGVAAAGAGPVMILLADQAAVTGDDLAALLSSWRQYPGRIAASRYGGALGVPAIFPPACRDALQQLDGDRGAKSLLAESTEISAVDMPNAAFDLDTPEDLALLGAVTGETTG